MASPQAEHGHMDLANEIVDAFCRNWPPASEGQILWAILRKTYGWNKQADKISISQFQELTGLSRRTVIYALQNLEAKRMVTIEKQPGGTNMISFQKDHEKWLVHNCAPQISKKREKTRDCQVVHNCAPVHNSVKTSAHVVHPQKTNKIQKNKYSDFFEKLWATYPSKEGRQAALKHFSRTVKSEEDCQRIRKSLDNYLAILAVEKWRRPQNGSTWFNGWQEWETATPDGAKKAESVPPRRKLELAI